VLEVKDLVKKYGNKTAVNGLNFHINRGEIVGLLGLNGAGKSTTMNCITGYIAPTSGTITVDGHDILKEPDKAKKVIGYLPEVFSYYSDMKVYEYLDFVCDIKGFTKNRKIRREHIEGICRKVGIWDKSGRMIRNLSKGYKQRTGFAQALIGNPKLLILDEPTVGLDPSQIIEIRQLIRDLGRESTVIVSSHIMSEIQAVCSRILVIHDGKVAADGSPEELIFHGADKNILNIRVKGDKAGIEAVLEKTAGITGYIPQPEVEEGACDYLVKGNSGEDIREAVFRAFASASGDMTLLRLESPEATLENTFLHLTGSEKGDDADDISL